MYFLPREICKEVKELIPYISLSTLRFLGTGSNKVLNIYSDRCREYIE
jgi:hypothetical protein